MDLGIVFVFVLLCFFSENLVFVFFQGVLEKLIEWYGIGGFFFKEEFISLGRGVQLGQIVIMNGDFFVGKNGLCVSILVLCVENMFFFVCEYNCIVCD